MGLARGFGLKTVAEGVEDAEAYELLAEIGVDLRPGLPHRPPRAAGISKRQERSHMPDDETIEPEAETPPGLVQEQAIADLDQSVADREQALADADQAAVEREQAEVDEERATTDTDDFGRSVHFMHRQAELDRRQARGDARQEQIEQVQEGGDQRQDLLDAQMEETGRARAGRRPPPSSRRSWRCAEGLRSSGPRARAAVRTRR